MKYDIRRTNEIIQRLCIKARVCRARVFVLNKRKKRYTGQQTYIREAEAFANRCEVQARYLARTLRNGAPQLRVRPSDLEIDVAWAILIAGGQDAVNRWVEQLQWGQEQPPKPDVHQPTLL